MSAAAVSAAVSSSAGSSLVSSQNRYLSLSLSLDLKEFNQHWYDPSLKHFLLLHEDIYYVYTLGNGSDSPVLLYHDKQFPDKVKILLARLSLDLQIIAIQTSLTKVLIIDTSNEKRWMIDIKFNDDNYILSDGLLWSDHGGNSQDLIIVTRKGLELYKISSLRGQCKLSRSVSSSVLISSFWYEAAYRMILIASINNPQQNTQVALSSIRNSIAKSIGRGPNYTSGFTMNGYYFRKEKSDNFPKLELPPPEKIPKFDVGDNVNIDGIFLMTIYGNLYCIANYSHCNPSHLVLYRITKTNVIKSHILLLHRNGPDAIRLSISDNLLLCHLIGIRMTLIFDIKIKTKVENDYDVIEPLCKPTSLYFEEEVVKSGNKGSFSVRSPSFSSLPLPPTLNDSISKSIDMELMSSDDEGDYQDAWDAVGDPVTPIRASTNDIEKPSDLNKSPQSKNVSSTNTMHLAQIAYEESWDFLPPMWVWDKKGRQVWRIKNELAPIASSIYDSAKAITFLIRRGQQFDAPCPVYKFNFDGAESSEAKQLILKKILAAIENKMGISHLESIFQAIAEPYATECNYLATLRAQSLSEDENDNQESNKKAIRIRKASFMDEFLEPAHALNLFLPDIIMVGGRSRVRARSNSGDNYVPHASIPLSTRRNYQGEIIVNQCEVICYIWLPIIFNTINEQKQSSSYVTWALSTFIAVYRNTNAIVHPAICLLLLNLLSSRNEYMELCRLLQLQFFPDNAELAMSALELADSIEENELRLSSKQPKVQSDYNPKEIYLRSAVATLQQVGLDMLWRLHERSTVIRWLLGHGRVIEAISLCSKKKGQWRSGLSPGSIPGVDFFTSAISAIQKLTISNENELEIDYDDGYEHDDTQQNEVQKGTMKVYNYRGEILQLLHTVYKFLSEWDHTSLNPCNGLSKLASLTTFPDNLPIDAQCIQTFRELFGFLHDK